MKIQRFANIYDEMVDTYNRSIEETRNRIGQQEAEKNQLIADYTNQYNNQLAEYQNLQDQQKANIDQWAETQREQQQKQTDYELGLIEQNRQDAETQTKTEQANAYIDYQKGLNEFGGSSEQLASMGLSGTGFAKNQDIAMNITYQNRVSAANSALMKSNRDFDNQIQQALLTKDANLAQLAYEEMQQQYQLALGGFEYRTNLWNQKLGYETQINNTYFDRINNYQNLIKNYQDSINATRQAQQQFNEQQRQFNAQMALSRAKASSKSGSSYTDSSSGGKKYNSSLQLNTVKGAVLSNATLRSNLSSDKAYKNAVQLIEATDARGGATAAQINNYLSDGKSSGVYSAKDISYIKKLYGI